METFQRHTNDDSTEEVSLILRAQEGDHDALERLLLGIYPSLLRYATRMVGHDNAEDIIQEVLLQICRKLKWLEEPLAFRAWAYRIAHRISTAHAKRERQWRQRSSDEDTLMNLPANDKQMDADSLTGQLEALSQNISPRSRSVLVMHYCDDLSLDEIAIILNIPIGTAKSRLAYGLAALRRLVNPKGVVK